MIPTEINERSLHLLKALVARYIRDGMPVGSKTLAQDSAVALSSASIRNVMAELEEAGYIRSPHTSAGRIPTDLGYRLFVDSVVTTSATGSVDQSSSMFGSEVYGNEMIDNVRSQLSTSMSHSELAETASTVLSNITRQAGLVLLPRNESISFRQVEFLPLSNQRVLVILVLDEYEVQNRIIHTDRDYSEVDLQHAAAFVNQHYSGREVHEVRSALLASMQEDKSIIDQLMQSAIDFASKALEGVDQPRSDYVMAGQANLIDSHQEDVHRLRELFDAFQQKKDILHLMERCAQGEGVQIFIGEESGFEVLDDFSLITAPYQMPGQPMGVLGVIGPTRMAYERVVPIVDITARLLSAAMKG